MHAVEGKIEKHTQHLTGKLHPVGEAFLAMLERDQQRLLRLCATLEQVADGLPESRDNVKTARVLSFLNGAFERHIFLHEKCLFPFLRSLAAGRPSIEPVLNQLEFEHASDHGLVHEITSAFVNGHDAKLHAGDVTFGYLLRSFFENYRRHHSWERNILYPVARQNLTGGTVAGQRDALLRVSLGLGS